MTTVEDFTISMKIHSTSNLRITRTHSLQPIRCETVTNPISIPLQSLSHQHLSPSPIHNGPIPSSPPLRRANPFHLHPAIALDITPIPKSYNLYKTYLSTRSHCPPNLTIPRPIQTIIFLRTNLRSPTPRLPLRRRTPRFQENKSGIRARGA